MYNDRTIAVAVPSYNQELLIGDSLFSIPSFVDRINSMHDAQNDKTPESIEAISLNDRRIILIRNKKNFGLGAQHCAGCSYL